MKTGEFVHGNDFPLNDPYLDELWEDIPGFPNYSISTYGRVWSEFNQKMLIPTFVNRQYFGVCLYSRGYKKTVYIHRIMAIAFLPNPCNYPVVRHLDDDPTNNCIENLAWGTHAENFQDAVDNGIIGITGKRSWLPIRVIFPDGHYEEFENQHEAARCLNLCISSIRRYVGTGNSFRGLYFEDIN